MDVDGTPLPGDLPVIERSAVRVVVTDAADRVLLFHTHDVDHPDLGQWLTAAQPQTTPACTRSVTNQPK